MGHNGLGQLEVRATHAPKFPTFRSHVKKTCDVLSFKATWFLKVIIKASI